jgi:hypothetical protein
LKLAEIKSYHPECQGDSTMAKTRTKRVSGRTRQAKARRTAHAAGRPRTREAFLRSSDRQRHNYVSAVNAIAKMRADGLSLPRAARAVGTDAKTVIRLAGPALRKDKRGRWKATKRDTLLRVLSLPSPRGNREIAVTNSRAAVHIARYFEAIRRYIHSGDASPLHQFRRVKLVDAKGKRIMLVTNLRALDQLGHAGVLSFESLYARTT